jgi:mono/diheme cytochrome c family protein
MVNILSSMTINMRKAILTGLTLTALLSCQSNKKPAEDTHSQGSAEVTVTQGEALYKKYCLVCHQQDGSGVPGMYPPIKSTDWVQGDAKILIRLLLNGQQGPIKVNGAPFKGIMPPHQYLSNVEIAEILSYIRSNFGNQAAAVTSADVAAQRDK